MIHAVFVPGEPPEGLLANFGFCPVDATVVARVTVLGAVRVRSLVVLPVKSVAATTGCSIVLTNSTTLNPSLQDNWLTVAACNPTFAAIHNERVACKGITAR